MQLCRYVSQVMTNGVIYLGAPMGECCPVPFASIPSQATPFIAPYWIDNDPSMRGNVSYEIHAGNGPLLQLVNDHISSSQNVTFCGTWMMVAYWWDVPELFLEDMVRCYTCANINLLVLCYGHSRRS